VLLAYCWSALTKFANSAAPPDEDVELLDVLPEAALAPELELALADEVAEALAASCDWPP
jgi:hypothetical protein